MVSYMVNYTYVEYKAEQKIIFIQISKRA